MVRIFKRDAKGRFARTSSRRAVKKAAKQKYRSAKARSRAQLNREYADISKMSEKKYNQYLDKGTYRGSAISGQDLFSASLDSHQKRVRAAKVQYKATVRGSKVKR